MTSQRSGAAATTTRARAAAGQPRRPGTEARPGRDTAGVVDVGGRASGLIAAPVPPSGPRCGARFRSGTSSRTASARTRRRRRTRSRVDVACSARSGVRRACPASPEPRRARRGASGRCPAGRRRLPAERRAPPPPPAARGRLGDRRGEDDIGPPGRDGRGGFQSVGGAARLRRAIATSSWDESPGQPKCHAWCRVTPRDYWG